MRKTRVVWQWKVGRWIATAVVVYFVLTMASLWSLARSEPFEAAAEIAAEFGGWDHAEATLLNAGWDHQLFGTKARADVLTPGERPSLVAVEIRYSPFIGWQLTKFQTLCSHSASCSPWS